jgi:Hypoxia induced protein conserved region
MSWRLAWRRHVDHKSSSVPERGKPAIHCTNRAIGMEGLPRYLITAAVVAVFLVLLAGLWNMMRGANPNLSQTLMRWRVGLQFLAIVLMMFLVYLWRS